MRQPPEGLLTDLLTLAPPPQQSVDALRAFGFTAGEAIGSIVAAKKAARRMKAFVVERRETGEAKA